MQIYLDFSYFNELLSLSGPQLMWRLFADGGWLVFVFLLLWFLWIQWLNARQTRFGSKVNYTLLAIDVPRENEQSPKAVEHLMTNLGGAHTPFSKWEEWYEGAYQLSFSFEIVSMDGYIQFLVRTPDFWRDMIEAAVYAQYPDAEITEVEDYVTPIPDHYPNDEYNFYGAELVPVVHEAFPFKTYIEFEHSLSQELKDPLAALLEIFSRLQQGEQMWFQLIIKPTDNEWQKGAKAVVDKLIGAKAKVSENIADKVIKNTNSLLNDVSDSLLGTTLIAGKEVKKEDAPNQMLYMTPGARSVVEKIERKMSKLGFYCKLRIAYVAKKEYFNKPARVGTIFSAIKQYNTLDCNAFKPGKSSTRALYAFAKQRVIAKQNRFMEAYKSRSSWMGTPEFILNVEELATLYHFPAINIKAPLLRRTDAKKSEPPASLPFDIEDEAMFAKPVKLVKTEQIEEPVKTSDEKINYMPDSLKNYDFENKYFEDKFGKDKSSNTKKDETIIKKTDKIMKQEQGITKQAPPNLPIIE